MLHTKLHVTAEKCILRGPALQNSLGTHIVHPCSAQHPRCTQCMVLFTQQPGHTLHDPVPHNSLGTHIVHPCSAQHPRCTHRMALLHTTAWAHTAWPRSTQQLFLLPVLFTWDNSHLFYQSTFCPLTTAPCGVLSLTSQ